MILKAFGLLDMKVGAFGVPFFMAHVGQAIRAVTDLGQDANTTVGRHPADFALVELGTFDDASGALTACTPVNHGTVLGFLPQPQSEFPMTLPLQQKMREAMEPDPTAKPNGRA